MVVKAIELPEGRALVFDRALADLTGLVPGTEWEVETRDGGLFLAPAKGGFDPAFLAAVEQGLERYAETFRRLAQ